MSIYPSPDKLDAMKSKYALVILAAKRARQIKDGARRLLPTSSTNPLTIALEEIAAGQIIERIVEDPTVKAHQAALKPNEPSLEDIIGAGSVTLDVDPDSPAAMAAVLRSAEPDSDDEDLIEEEPDETLTPVDAFVLSAPELVQEEEEDDEEEEDLIPDIEEEE